MRIALKMAMKRIPFIILFFLFISEICFAEVYRWVDEKGAVHFTDDITQVPERYRSKTEEIGSPEGKEEAKPEGEATPRKKEETYKDQLGRGEDYWKGRVVEWKQKRFLSGLCSEQHQGASHGYHTAISMQRDQ